MAPEPIEQVAAHAGQQVVALERARRDQLIDDGSAASGPDAMETATARFSSTIGDGAVRASSP